VRGRVFAVTAAGEKLISDKQYTLPADRDWFELPVVPEPGCSHYRMELSQPTGVVGWYRAADGTLAYRAWSYAEPTNTAAAVPATDKKKSAAGTFPFTTREPFFGLHLNIATTNTEIRCRLLRELPGNGWSPAVAEQTVIPRTDGTATIYFEPQTAGRYQIEILNSRSQLTVVTPISLVRKTAALPALPFAKPGGIVLFEPMPGQNPALKLDSELAFSGSSNGVVNLEAQSPDAGFELKLNSPLTAKPGQMLALQLRNHTAAAFARIYLAEENAEFTTERSTLLPLVQNDTELREYHCPLDLESGWHGKIRRWRIEPAAGLSASGISGVGTILVLDSATLTPPSHPKNSP
jgi:hypothetical protein